MAGEKFTASDTFILYFAQGRPQIWPELAGDTPHTVILHRGMLIFSKRPLRWPGIERGPPRVAGCENSTTEPPMLALCRDLAPNLFKVAKWQARILPHYKQCWISYVLEIPTCFTLAVRTVDVLTLIMSRNVTHCLAPR